MTSLIYQLYLKNTTEQNQDLENLKKRGVYQMPKNGNKHDNGVHELGTDETVKAYQEDTPGQAVEKYVKDNLQHIH